MRLFVESAELAFASKTRTSWFAIPRLSAYCLRRIVYSSSSKADSLLERSRESLKKFSYISGSTFEPQPNASSSRYRDVFGVAGRNAVGEALILAKGHESTMRFGAASGHRL